MNVQTNTAVNHLRYLTERPGSDMQDPYNTFEADQHQNANATGRTINYQTPSSQGNTINSQNHYLNNVTIYSGNDQDMRSFDA